VTLRRFLSTLIACFWCISAVSLAQEDYAAGSLNIRVLDPNERLISDAQVMVVNLANGASTEAVITPDGYQVRSIPPGTYKAEVTARGFKRSVAGNLVVHLGEIALYNVKLDVGPVSESVKAQANLSLLQPEQTQQANIINNVQLESLPNVSRNFVGSVYTLPGVVNSYAPTLQDPGVGTAYLSSGFSIGASNGRSNLVTIDGGEDEYGSGTMREMHVPIDSVQEFQVNRNAFEAEFGFTSGSAINMVTKSGTSQFHGSAAGYFHDRTTDAGNYFDKLAGLGAKPFEQSAILSATLGGPLRRSRFFFFTAPEYQKLDAATVQNIAAEQEFQGIASQNNGFDGGSCPGQNTPQQQVTQLCYLTQMANSGGPLSGLGSVLLASTIFGNPLLDPILNALVTPEDGTFDGIPASPVGSGVRGLPGFSTPRGRYFNWVTRLDNSYAKNSFTLRFALMRESDSVAPRPPYSGNEFQTDYTVTGYWMHVASPRFANTARVQIVPSNTASIEAPSPNGSEIDLGNQIQLGTPFTYPYFAHFRRFQFDDTLTWTRKTHTFKFGGSWRPDYYSVGQKLWFGGTWDFTDGTFSILNLVRDPVTAAQLESYNQSQGYPTAGPPSTNLTAVQAFLAGTPTLLLQANPESNARWSGWTDLLGLFAQDSWKAHPRLSVNYGVRLDYDREPAPVPRSVRISPRVGIAWDAGGNQKTIVRAGCGIYVAPDTFMIPFYANILGTSGKYVNQTAVVAGLPSPPFPSIFAAWALQNSLATATEPNPAMNTKQLASVGIVISPPGPAAFGNFIYTMAPHFQPAYSIQASLSIARQLAKDLSLEAGYIMYHSVHVEQILESNFVEDTSTPTDPFTGPHYVQKAGTTAGEPNISIFQNNAFSSVGSGTYHGGTLSLRQRYEHGLQFQANYTFSRAIDDTSDFSSISTPFRPGLLNRDYGLSDFNITHNFVANAVYQTPFAVERGKLVPRILANVIVSPIVSVRSGIPFTLLVPGLSNGTIGHNANARPWFEGRNQGIGPHFVSWDMRVSKAMTFAQERLRVEVIAQAQNLLNHTNFAAVNNNLPADPNYPLAHGTLETGPYNVKGFAPSSVSQLSQPLAFTASYPGRQVSLALRLAF
jgi:hypothetical protein